MPLKAANREVSRALIRLRNDRSAVGLPATERSRIVGVAAAITSAVFHATGKRIRELPVTPDKLL